MPNYQSNTFKGVLIWSKSHGVVKTYRKRQKIQITICEKLGTDGGVKKADRPMVGRCMVGDPWCEGTWVIFAFCSVGCAAFALFLRGPRSAWTALKRNYTLAASKLYTKMSSIYLLCSCWLWSSVWDGSAGTSCDAPCPPRTILVLLV